MTDPKKNLDIDANTALHVIALAEKGNEFMKAVYDGNTSAMQSVFISSVDTLLEKKKAKDAHVDI